MKQKTSTTGAPIISILFLSLFFTNCANETASSETTTTVPSEPMKEEPSPWVTYTDSVALYSIKFPEEPVAKIDTTNQFFVHVAAYETESSFYKVSAFVQKFNKTTGEPIDYVYAMRNSISEKYTVTLEEEQIINNRKGLHVEALRDDWAFSRFLVAENDILYVIDMAKYGSDVPSSISVDGFRNWFDVLTVEKI